MYAHLSSMELRQVNTHSAVRQCTKPQRTHSWQNKLKKKLLNNNERAQQNADCLSARRCSSPKGACRLHERHERMRNTRKHDTQNTRGLERAPWLITTQITSQLAGAASCESSVADSTPRKELVTAKWGGHKSDMFVKELSLINLMM